MSDPLLKEARAEMLALLKKYDIGACVTLVSKTHAEFFYHINPSWSVMSFEGSSFLRFRAKRSDFKSVEDQRMAVELSVHLACQISDLNIKSANDMEVMISMLKDRFDIQHTPYYGFEPDPSE